MSVPSKALSTALVGGLFTSLLITGCARTPEGYVQGEDADDTYAANFDEASAVDSINAENTDSELITKSTLVDTGEEGLGVELLANSSKTEMHLEPVGMVNYQVSRMENPSRLIIDVDGFDIDETKTYYIDDSPHVDSLRFGRYGDKGRLVFDISQGFKNMEAAGVERVNEKLVVVFNEENGAQASNNDIEAYEQGLAKTDSNALSQKERMLASLEQDYGNQDEEQLAMAEPGEGNTSSLDDSFLETPEPSLPNELAAEDAASRAMPGQFDTSKLDSLGDDDTTAAGHEVKKQFQPSSQDPFIVSSLAGINFDKAANGLSQLRLNLSDDVPFDLSRTTPTEYVLTLAGTVPEKAALIPQISSDGTRGIRSARAVQEGENAVVRMFVADDYSLLARKDGFEIVIEAQKGIGNDIAAAGQYAADPQSRAQAAPGGDNEQVSISDDIASVNPGGIASDDGKKIYTGRLISLDLQDTDIDNALRIIAEVSNLNIIASDDVSGKVTLRLIDVPWDQALDVILKTNGLDQVKEGNVIRIAPVDKLRQEREARRQAKKALEELEELNVNYYRVSYAKASEVQEQVEGVITERGTVTVDERTNQIIVKDVKKGHDEALKLIKRLDLRTPQILLETQIVEGTRDILRDLGFQWNYNYARAPEFGNATGLNFPNSVAVGGSSTGGNVVDFPAGAGAAAVDLLLDSADGARSLGARLSALETEGRGKVISRPQIATVNNKQAIIKSVESIRIRPPSGGTSVATGEGASASGGGSNAFEEFEIGIELTVTPNASSDYYVLLDMFAKSSTLGSNTVDGIPSTVDRTVTSTILVKSGQTFALGGVYRIEDLDNIAGVPWLKDIPFFGTMFRNTNLAKGDEELIFFITPHIVEGSFDPSLM